MKRIITLVLCFLMTAALGMTAMAAGAPSADLRGAADALNLSDAASDNASALKELHAKGVRVFDTGDLLGAEDTDKLEMLLAGVADKTGFDVGIITSNGLSGCGDVETYSEMLYDEGGFGTGSENTGTILVVDMAGHNVHIDAVGEANRYMTDNAKNYIFDKLNGGLISKLGDGDYAGAFAVYAEGVLKCYEAGVSEDQHNYNTQTGQTDYYYPQEKEEKHLTPFKALIAAVMSALSGFAPVSRVKRQYAMETEKRLAEGFNLAYRSASSYNVTKGQEAQFLRSFVRTAPIPRQQPKSGSGHSFNSGRTTVHTSHGGNLHSGSSRKF